MKHVFFFSKTSKFLKLYLLSNPLQGEEPSYDRQERPEGEGVQERQARQGQQGQQKQQQGRQGQEGQGRRRPPEDDQGEEQAKELRGGRLLGEVRIENGTKLFVFRTQLPTYRITNNLQF